MTNSKDKKNLSREKYLEREREYKKAQRERDQLSRTIENKHNKSTESQKILLNIDEEVINGLSEFSNFYEMSRRSRTILINNFLKTRLRQVKEITSLAEKACIHRGAAFKNETRAIAMEVAIRGGSRNDFSEGINQLNEEIERVAMSRDDRTVAPEDINIFNLRIFKNLNQAN